MSHVARRTSEIENTTWDVGRGTWNVLAATLIAVLCTSLLNVPFCHAVSRPDRIKGVYVSIWAMYTPQKVKRIVEEGKKVGINTLVCDFKGSSPKYLESYRTIKKENMYSIARICVFEEGIGATVATAEDPVNWNKKIAWAREAQKLGFDEIQYDYIRFEDAGYVTPKKKEIVEKFLKEAKAAVNIPVGIDVFGSVAYQPHRVIGQDLGTLSDIIDAVSPMLYPSHFFKDPYRMSRPYETMLEGCTMANKQINGRPVRLIPFVQGFAMNLSYAKMNLKDYIIAQLKAVDDAKTAGFFVWNAASDYRSTWQAMEEMSKGECRISNNCSANIKL